MKKYDIVVPHKYTKDGEEKTAWKNVGTLTRFDATGDKPEGFVMEMNMYPDTTFKVFEQKPRDMGNIPGTNQPYPAPADDMPTPF